jgi:hypothetical protein
MNIGDAIAVSGCFTKERYFAGRTLREIETLLGFHQGRMRDGMETVALMRLPEAHEFEILEYTDLVTGTPRYPEGADIAEMKRLSRGSWLTSGIDRIVKVLPRRRHDVNVSPDIQNPPPFGVAQWVLKLPVPGRVVAVVTGYPDARY